MVLCNQVWVSHRYNFRFYVATFKKLPLVEFKCNIKAEQLSLSEKVKTLLSSVCVWLDFFVDFSQNLTD